MKNFVFFRVSFRSDFTIQVFPFFFHPFRWCFCCCFCSWVSTSWKKTVGVDIAVASAILYNAFLCKCMLVTGFYCALYVCRENNLIQILKTRVYSNLGCSPIICQLWRTQVWEGQKERGIEMESERERLRRESFPRGKQVDIRLGRCKSWRAKWNRKVQSLILFLVGFSCVCSHKKARRK